MADRRAHNLFDLIFFFSDLELVSKSENFGKSTVKMLEPFCNILFTFISLFQINWLTTVAAVEISLGGLLWQRSSFKGTLKSMWRQGHAEGR